MLSTLEIHERRGSDQITLALQGELDFCSGAELAIRLADEGRLGARIAITEARVHGLGRYGRAPQGGELGR
jgi:hypothetical protein